MMKVFCAVFVFFFMSFAVLAEEYLPEGKTEKPVVNNILLEDELVKNIKIKKYPRQVNYKFKDELLENIDPSKIKEIEPDLTYDFSDINKITIPIRSMKLISSENADMANIVEFVLVKDVKLNKNNIIPAGTKVSATIEYALAGQLQGENGILIIDRFKIEGFPDLKPEGKIYKEGANRALWIIPLAKVVNMFTYAGGYPLYLIKGGNAKIEPDKIYEIYLWGEY